MDNVSPETFPLPTLEPKLTQLALLIHSGQGFFVIRGLDPERYSPLEKVVAYTGITSYVGGTRACQDAGGSKLSARFLCIFSLTTEALGSLVLTEWFSKFTSKTAAQSSPARR